MVLTALRGGFGFLSRLPVGRDERAWEAFRRTPAAFPLVGYVVGAALALPLLLPLPAPTVALLFLAWVYAVTGINHLDGVADLGDAAVVHGGTEARREAMRDTQTGVGALLAVGLVVAGLALAGLALAGSAVRLPGALAVVVAAEVGAKLGMAVLAGLGSPAHEGMGSALAGSTRPASLVLPAILALPAAALSWPRPAAGAALGTAVLVALAVGGWARVRLDGVSGDVLGAANELARVAALHAGVIAWTRF